MRVLTVLLFAISAISSTCTSSRENKPSSIWDRDLTHTARDERIPLPSTSLGEENIGTVRRVADIFDLWTLDPSRRFVRWNSTVVDVTRECKGKIELEFALTLEEWREPVRRANYHRAASKLIDHLGATLILDVGNELPDAEREMLIQAFPVLAWQESSWQHYYRYKNWFFVVASGGSFNELEDWGILQIARSTGRAENLLNEDFFQKKGYCSISSTLYYGFLKFYVLYKEARLLECNSEGTMTKLTGAYNMYSSGVGLCHDARSDNEKFRDYQVRALSGFTKRFTEKPWEQFMQ